jgi:hypothetical protein
VMRLCNVYLFLTYTEPDPHTYSSAPQHFIFICYYFIRYLCLYFSFCPAFILSQSKSATYILIIDVCLPCAFFFMFLSNIFSTIPIFDFPYFLETFF